MLSFTQIYESYQAQASLLAFPADPQKLYGSITYFMNNPGKKVRPVLCLMGNELFSEIQSDSYMLLTITL